MNGLISFDKTDREYSPALLRTWLYSGGHNKMAARVWG